MRQTTKASNNYSFSFLCGNRDPSLLKVQWHGRNFLKLVAMVVVMKSKSNHLVKLVENPGCGRKSVEKAHHQTLSDVVVDAAVVAKTVPHSSASRHHYAPFPPLQFTQHSIIPVEIPLPGGSWKIQRVTQL